MNFIKKAPLTIKKHTRDLSRPTQNNKVTQDSLIFLKNTYSVNIKGILYQFINIAPNNKNNDVLNFSMETIEAFFSLTTVDLKPFSIKKLNIYELLFKFFTEKSYFKNLKDSDYLKIVGKFYQVSNSYICILSLHMMLNSTHILWFEANELFLVILKNQAIDITSLVDQTTDEAYQRTIDLIFIRMKNLENFAFNTLKNILTVLQSKGESNNVTKDPLSVLNLYLVGQNNNSLSKFLKNIISLCYDSEGNKSLIFTEEQKKQVKSYFDKIVAILQVLESFQSIEKTIGIDTLQVYNDVYINKALMELFLNEFYFKELKAGSEITNTQFKKLIYILNRISLKLQATFFFDLISLYNKILLKANETS